MKRANKVLAMILAMLMIFSSVVITTVSAAEDHGNLPTTFWAEADAAADFGGGDGTSASTPYLIQNESQFLYFAKWVEAGNMDSLGAGSEVYFKLEADLDFSEKQWDPIGNVYNADDKDSTNYQKSSFRYGIFDGGNHTIRGINLTASEAISGYTYENGIGLFARMTYSTIQNLNAEVKILNPVFKAGTFNNSNRSSSVGSLVGVVYGEHTNTVLDKCNVTLDLDVEGTGGQYYYGGLTGYTNDGCRITNCTTNGSMKVVTPANCQTLVGGMIGFAQVTMFDNCVNNIDIEVTMGNSQSLYVGGIFSRAGQGIHSQYSSGTDLNKNPSNTEFSLTNNGDITVNIPSTIAPTAEKNVAVGGLFGNPSVVRKHLEKMLNTGNITVNNSTTNTNVKFYVGGIIGIPFQHADNLRIGDENRGNITFNGVIGAEVKLGGLIGENQLTQQSCVNRGTIALNGVTSGCRVGGLVGNNLDDPVAKLQSCSNYGAVNINDDATNGNNTNMRYIGGLVGLVAGPDGVVVDDCHNYGAITYNSYGAGEVGGIASCISAGNSSAYTTTIQNTTNHADVTVINRNGELHRPLGGILGSTRLNSKLINCTNEGTVWQKDVIGNSNATGGILGTVSATVSDIKDANDFDGDKNTTEKLTFTNTPTLQGCINKGEVKLTTHATKANTSSTTNRWLGGILGNGAGMLRLLNCTNDGPVTYTSSYSNKPKIGGIVGEITANSLVSGCVNTAKGIITVSIAAAPASGSALYLGGIVGNDSGDLSLTNVADHTAANKGIRSCTNNGTINVTKAATASYYIGGVLGRAASGTYYVIDCTNNGTFNINYSKDANVGGIIGSIMGGSYTVTNATNNGALNLTTTASPTARVGGIIGNASSAVTNTGHVNNGDITVSGPGAHYMAGIVGEMAGSSTTKTALTDCLNTGSIISIGATGNDAPAGILSRVGSNTVNALVKLDKCINIGEVTQTSLAGGIIGYTAATGGVKSSFTDTNDYDGDGNTTETINGWIDVEDRDNDGSTTDLVTGYVTYKPVTVHLVNCIGYGSGVQYALIGSARASYHVFENCFGNTEYLISYYNQNANYYIAKGQKDVVHINGEAVSGNDIAFNPANCAHVMLETLDKARVRINSTADAEVSGIRFDSYITKESYNEIKALTGVTLDIGTIISPTQILSMSEVTGAYDKKAAMDALGGTRYVTVPYDVTAQGGFLSSDGYKLSDKEDYYFFAGALEEIKEANYNVKFTAIAYATVTVGDFSFTFYADYDPANTERARSIAQVANSAFEDRATVETVINGVAYDHIATAENECYLGQYSPYSNPQLALLKTYSGYINNGTMPEGFSVNGVSISDYKIVYRHSPLEDKVGSSTGGTIYEDLSNVTLGTINFGDVLLGAKYDYDYQTACRVRDLIAAEYGVTLPVVKDTDTAETDYEILVGLTNRAKSKTAAILAQNADEFTFKIDGSKIVICGGSYGSTWHAVDELEELFATLDEANYNFKMAGDLDGLYVLKKIACIGDSITRGSQALPVGATFATSTTGFDAVYGSNASTIYLEQYLSYPANLQRTLWKDAIVYNFGRGASTAGNYNNPSNYYEANVQWRNCYATSNDPDIAFDLVFMQHGTNDADQNGGAYNWNTAKKDFFAAAVDSLISKILEGSPNATFVLNNAPHAFDGNKGTGGKRNEANDEAIREVQLYTAQKLAAKYAPQGITILHYDMNRYTAENLKAAGSTCTLPANPTTNPSENLDSSAEAAVHGEYYNITDLGPNNEGTHPNYKGYNKIAAGVNGVVQWQLFNGIKPVYMIDVA